MLKIKKGADILDTVIKTGNLIAATFGAFLVPAFEYLYGEGEVVLALMAALVFFIAMDWITGIRASKKEQSYGTKYGIDGVFRSFFILLLPAGGHLLDKIIGSPGLIFGILGAGIIYHVIQSMTANAIRAGWGEWVPDWILTRLTEWVKQEIESKLARSKQRKAEKEIESNDY